MSVTPSGVIYVAHSNPDPTPPPNNPAAVYRVRLTGSTATLIPVFGINDTARVINPAPGAPASAPLGLTDPDSNRFVRGKDGGTLIQDAQADSKLVFVTKIRSAHPALRQLNLSNAATPSGGAATPQLDDIVPVDGPGTLFVVDQSGGGSYTVDTAGIDRGTLFVSQPKPSASDQPNDPALAVVDPVTGVVTHVDSNLGSPKGLLFVPSVDGDDQHQPDPGQ